MHRKSCLLFGFVSQLTNLTFKSFQNCQFRYNCDFSTVMFNSAVIFDRSWCDRKNDIVKHFIIVRQLHLVASSFSAAANARDADYSY